MGVARAESVGDGVHVRVLERPERGELIGDVRRVHVGVGDDGLLVPRARHLVSVEATRLIPCETRPRSLAGGGGAWEG
jgi:hypothetical protein